MSEREYLPDVWVVVEFSGTKVPEPYRRVLAGWFGGYVGSNSWRLSSGITETIDHDDHWEFSNKSGSVYRCSKGAERYCMMTQSIFESYESQNNAEVMIKRIPYGEGLDD